jgi:UDP-N-acetylglucosamine 2-epimerase
VVKVLQVVGARPNFVKTAPVIRALEARGGVDQRIVHTGQHYDPRMSAEMLTDLRFPAPHVFLGVVSGPHGSVPCFTLWPNTERPVTIEQGTNTLGVIADAVAPTPAEVLV